MSTVSTVSTSAPLEIHRVHPLAHADDIKALFAENERPEFPDYFDRAFPSARGDVSSWVGVDENGRVCMHIARFRHRFTAGRRVAIGGLLANLLTAREHRTFFPALRLVRKVVADSRDDGDVDFLYGDPNDRALPLLKTAGLTPLGQLGRFVLPLRGGSLPVDAAIRLYHTLLARMGRWRGHGRATSLELPQVDPESFTDPPGVSSRVRPHRPPELFARRLAGYPGAAYQWLVIRARDRRQLARVLVRAASDSTTQLCCIVRPPDVALSSIMRPLVKTLRHAGYHRLWLWTLTETRFSTDLQRAGFLRRTEALPVLGVPFTALGAELLNDVFNWETTHLDYDR